MNRSLMWSWCFLVLASLSVHPSRAQCPDWNDGFQCLGLNRQAVSLAVFDDGAGSALYVAGEFSDAGGTSASRIAKWNGSSWSSVGAGVNGDVFTLTVFDDGTGIALYAGGIFATAGGVPAKNIAKWNGSSWSALSTGLNEYVLALEVFDDGAGSALYAGGAFTVAGGTSASRIAKWNGSSWSALSTGTDGLVTALTVFDDGTGAALHAGGMFTAAGGASANGVARWNGSGWSALGSGLSNSPPVVLAVFDHGAGPSLYAGKANAGGTSNVWMWNGADWIVLSTGSSNDTVSALTVFDDGTGPALFVGGHVGLAGGVSVRNLAKWDGATWTAVGGGTDTEVYALATFDDGTGEALYLCGSFTEAGGVGANHVARWDGASFSALGSAQGMNGPVHALTAVAGGPGPALLAGGEFTNAGDRAARLVSGRSGVDWSTLGSGLSTPTSSGHRASAFALFDDGTGPAVHVGGRFFDAGGVPANLIARWNGSAWSVLGSGMAGTAARVDAFAVFDDGTGSQLYAGGQFTSAGGVPVSNIARWNGSAWSAVGSGTGSVVRALAVFDDGTGAALYAGGDTRVHRWNGSSWSGPLGPGTNGAVYALHIFDDGAGSALYAGGDFSTSNPPHSPHVTARWNGSSWSALGSNPNSRVRALTDFDDGGGSALYAGGDFTTAGGLSANRIAKWNGSSWSALGSGTNGIVRALAAVDAEGDGVLDLWIGGDFTMAGGRPSWYIAKWSSCGPGLPYCFGDGLDPVVTAQCPCASFGDPGRGCANSDVLLGGARLSATGSTHPNTVLFTCDGIPDGSLCTFLRGTASVPTGAIFGDGVTCASGTLLRFGRQTAGLGGNPSNAVSVGAVGVAPGNTRYYHVQYRDQVLGFCPPALFNGSNGFILQW